MDLKHLTEILTDPQLEVVDDVDRQVTARILPKFVELADKGPFVILPENGETVGISGDHGKVAALFFDRVWASPFDETVPQEVLFYGGTDLEVLLAMALMAGVKKASARLLEFIVETPSIKNAMQPDQYFERGLAEAAFKEKNVVATPMYDGRTSLQRQYQEGSTEAVVAAITGLEVINESALAWEQITQFRADQDAKAKLRRLRHWLDSEFVGKSIGFVTDEIGTRLDDYEWALKKHGIKTISGSLSDLLDPRFIAAAGPIVGGLWFGAGTGLAEIAATGIMLGKVAISITNRLTDLEDRRRAEGAEVAFVHEIKSLSK